MMALLENERVRSFWAVGVTKSPAAHFPVNVNWRTAPARRKTTLAELKARLNASDDAVRKARANAMKIIGRPHL